MTLACPSPFRASVPFYGKKALDWMFPGSRCASVPKATAPSFSPWSVRPHHPMNFPYGDTEAQSSHLTFPTAAQSQVWNSGLSDVSLPCSVTLLHSHGCKGCLF